MSGRPTTFDALDDTDDTPDPSAVLVSLHFISTSLKRGWLFCVTMALLGLLAATGFMLLAPPSHEAKTSIVLARPAGADATFAMSTDIGMLTTRAVATQTVSRLGLSITPEEFLKSVKPDGVSSELLSITLTAPTGEEAVRRLSALASVFLEFRAQQLTRQSTVLIQGMQVRIDAMEAEVADLSQRIDRFPGTQNSSEISDLIGQRASLEEKIGNLEQLIEDATLSSNAVVSASRVIDPAAFTAGGIRRQIVLTLGSGLIAGATAGCALVLFQAVTSDRLRRRSDVAAAIAHPVTVSVGAVTPFPRALGKIPFLQGRAEQRSIRCSRVADAIMAQVDIRSGSDRLAIGCLENADEMRHPVMEAAKNIAKKGLTVALIDLSHDGCLNARFVTKVHSSEDLTVLRPLVAPELAKDTSDLEVADRWNDIGESWSQRSDVTIILADIEPIVGADYLTAWSDHLMLAISAGQSSAEKIRSVADLVRASGLQLQAAVLLRTDRLDDSSGLIEIPWPGDAQTSSDSSTESAQDSERTEAL